MTAAEAEAILRKHGVPHYDYSIGRPPSTECLVLERRGSGLVIYLWERGLEKFTEHYPNEDTASKKFARRMLWMHSRFTLKKDEIVLE